MYTAAALIGCRRDTLWRSELSVARTATTGATIPAVVLHITALSAAEHCSWLSNCRVSKASRQRQAGIGHMGRTRQSGSKAEGNKALGIKASGIEATRQQVSSE